jgi:hypothetical protein
LLGDTEGLHVVQADGSYRPAGVGDAPSYRAGVEDDTEFGTSSATAAASHNNNNDNSNNILIVANALSTQEVDGAAAYAVECGSRVMESAPSTQVINTNINSCSSSAQLRAALNGLDEVEMSVDTAAHYESGYSIRRSK